MPLCHNSCSLSYKISHVHNILIEGLSPHASLILILHSLSNKGNPLARSPAESSNMVIKAPTTFFSTPELIETIFIHLPLRDLLIIQRVSWQWKNAITTSPNLQQRLFLRPIQDPISGTMVLNPLLAALFPPILEIGRPESAFWDFPPTLRELRALDWFMDEKRREAILRKEASWRRMLPAQPPVIISKVIVNDYCDCQPFIHGEYSGFLPSQKKDGNDGDWWEHDVEKEKQLGEEVLMGFIYDLVVYMLEIFPHSGVEVRWPIVPIASPMLEDDKYLAPNPDSEEIENKMTTEVSTFSNQIEIHEAHSGGCYGSNLRKMPVDTGLRVKGMDMEFDPRCIEWETRPEGYNYSDHEDSCREFGPPKSFLRN